MSDFCKVLPPLLSFFSESLSSRFPTISMHHTAHVSLPPASLFLLILFHLLPCPFSAMGLHSVCASREFPFRLKRELRFSLLHSSLVLVCFPSWQRFVFLHVAGSVLHLRLSHKGPYSVMLQSPYPEGSSLYLPFSLTALFSLFQQDFHALIYFPVSDYIILFSLTYFLNLFIWLLHLWHFPPYMHFLSLPPMTHSHLLLFLC